MHKMAEQMQLSFFGDTEQQDKETRKSFDSWFTAYPWGADYLAKTFGCKVDDLVSRADVCFAFFVGLDAGIEHSKSALCRQTSALCQ